MHDRQIVLLGGAPDRFEIGVIDRPVVVEQGLHRDRPFRIAPFADFARRLADVARRGDDRAFEPVGERPAKLVHEAVVGADQPGFERYVWQPDHTRPDRGDQEMHIRAFGIHVEDSVVGSVVDYPRARPPLAAPYAAVGRSGTRLGLAQGALVGLVGKAVGVADAAVDAARFDGTAIRRQIIEARAKTRVDVFLQHIGTRVDMRIGVIDTETFLHASSPLQLLSLNPDRLI